MIKKSEFVKLVETIKPCVDKLAKQGEIVTEFEAITAIGFLYFCNNKKLSLIVTLQLSKLQRRV